MTLSLSIRIARKLQTPAIQAWRTLHGRAASMIAPLDQRNRILIDEPGRSAAIGTRVALFCHFDPAGEIRPHTRHYITELSNSGFDVVLVSNAGRLALPDMEWARNHVARILIRQNVGYDFGAWRDALARTRVPNPDIECLVLANDSLYGPFQRLSDTLSALDFNDVDVWGLTDSWQHRYHLQSYFLAFGRSALESLCFRRFWQGVQDVRSKWWVIRAYEVGLTQALLAGGLRCRAAWPYEQIIEALHERFNEGEAASEQEARNPFLERRLANDERALDLASRRVAMNPTSDLWSSLVEKGFPFIKRELLRNNPSHVPDVATWYDTLIQFQANPTVHEMIMTDLRRGMRGRAA
jgi:hypothetical protein